MVELLTEKEVAGRLRIGERTLREIRQRGEIAYVQIGRKILYRAEDCENFITSRVRNQQPMASTENRRQLRRPGDIVPFSKRK